MGIPKNLHINSLPLGLGSPLLLALKKAQGDYIAPMTEVISYLRVLSQRKFLLEKAKARTKPDNF